MKKNRLSYCVLLAAFATLLVACGKHAGLTPRDSVYLARRTFIADAPEIKVKPAFVPLPAGAVQPQGWIRDWAEAAAAGITGHLDERAATFGLGWTGVGFKAAGADTANGTGWPLEQCAYWLDGAVRLACILNDSALIGKIADRLNRVVDGVLDGGKSFVYWTDLDFQHGENATFNNWAHSHLGRALVAFYEATGNPRVLEALNRVYSKFRAQPVPFNFGNNVSGCCNIDPMLAVYELGGNSEVLARILETVGDSVTRDAVKRWNRGEFDSGHGVITCENLRIPAMMQEVAGIGSPGYDGDELLDGSLKYLRWLDDRHLLPCGLVSSEEFVAGVGATRHIETCNVACAGWTFQQMLEITGDARWGDRIEQVFFNAAPAPVSRDFQTMAYYQAPNRLSCFNTADHTIAGGDETFRDVGFWVLCCVGNLNRVVPNYIMHQWLGTLDGGLAAALYGPSTVRTVVGDGIPVEIVCETDYPFEETVRLTVNPAKECRFPLYLRIPEWCSSPTVSVGGVATDNADDRNGFRKIERRWKTGDTLVLRFPMNVRVAEGRETPFPQQQYFAHRRLAQVSDVNSPFRTVHYGPLLFALPVRDLDNNTQDPSAKWNYALVSRNADEVSVVRTAMPARWSWQIDEAPVKLKVKAREFDWQPTDLLPLPKDPVARGVDTEITLTPYGCTKFRITMFPTVN
jgi:hypothetical protein